MKRNISGFKLWPFVYKFSLFELLGKSYWFIEAEADHQYQFTLKQTARTWVNDHFDDYRAVSCKKRDTKVSVLAVGFELFADQWIGTAFYQIWFSWEIFFNHFGFRSVFASSFFLFNKCVAKATSALSRIQSNPAFRIPALPVPGVRIVECGAKKESDKKIRRKRGRGIGERRERLWHLFSEGHSAHFVG